MHKKAPKKEHNKQRQQQQKIWDIYGYLSFIPQTSFLSLIYQHTSMNKFTQALRTFSQGKDLTCDDGLTQTH